MYDQLANMLNIESVRFQYYDAVLHAAVKSSKLIRLET